MISHNQSVFERLLAMNQPEMGAFVLVIRSIQFTAFAWSAAQLRERIRAKVFAHLLNRM